MPPETTRRNQAGQDQSDDPRHAPESGDPELTGVHPGRDEDDQPDEIDASNARKGSDDEPDWESGRQQAN